MYMTRNILLYMLKVNEGNVINILSIGILMFVIN